MSVRYLLLLILFMSVFLFVCAFDFSYTAFQARNKILKEAFSKNKKAKAIAEAALDEFKNSTHGKDTILVPDLLKMTTIDALRHAMLKVFYCKQYKVYVFDYDKCPNTALKEWPVTGDKHNKCPFNALYEIVQTLAGITEKGSMDGKAVDQMIKFYRSVQRILQDEIEKSKTTGNSHGITTDELLYDFYQVSKDLSKTINDIQHVMNH